MAAVGRGDSPAQVLFGFLEDGFDSAMQVHIQERLRAGRRRDAGPDIASIGSPVEAGDSGPSLQREGPVVAAGHREKPDAGWPRNAVLLRHRESGTVRRESPVLQIPFRTFDPREQFFLSRSRVEAEEIQTIVRELAENTNRGRGASALKIIDAGILQNQLRSPAREWEAHETDAALHVMRIGIKRVENCRAVDTQAGKHDGLITADEQIGSRLIDGLLEKMKDAITIGSENHGFAVGCPGVGIISPLLEAEPLKRTQAAVPSFNLADVDTWGVGPPEKNESLAIGGNTSSDFGVRPIRKACGRARGVNASRVNSNSPEIGVILAIWGKLAERINQAAIGSPSESGTEARAG